jgi:sorting nexin-29
MPEEWAKAAIYSMHKKGDKLVCKNYRGIALLTADYQLLSITVNRWLVTWVERIVREYQSGFRQGRSTTNNIFSLGQMLENIMNIMWTCTTYS